jgi:hypothetical protein
VGRERRLVFALQPRHPVRVFRRERLERPVPLRRELPLASGDPRCRRPRVLRRLIPLARQLDQPVVQVGPLAIEGHLLLANREQLFVPLRHLLAEGEELFVLLVERLAQIEQLAA